MARLFLLLCGAAAILSIIAAFYFKGFAAIESWLVMAAALAVITSLFSAWSTQTTVSMQEDQLRPDVMIYIDGGSERYQLVQLRMKNVGNGSVYEISDDWRNAIHDHHGTPMQFRRVGSVTVLHQDQALSKAIDVQHRFYQNNAGRRFGGQINFKDFRGRRYNREFILDVEQYAGTLSYDQEEVRTHYELQQIPKKLDEIKLEIRKLASYLRRAGEDDKKDL